MTVILRSPSSVPMNATPTFKCMTSGIVTVIRWTKGPYHTIKADRKFKFSSSNRTLAVFKIQKSDQGSYYCHVTTADGRTESGSAKVHVIGRLCVLCSRITLSNISK